MVVQLYSEKNPETDQGYGLIENLVYRGLVEGQFTPQKVKLNVVKADQVGDKFKNAVKKAKNAQYLEDAELLVVFQSPQNAAPEESPEESPEEKPAEQPEQAPSGDDSGETVSESIKVQDLSKQVGLKSVGKKSCCGGKSCCCGKGKKKSVKEEEEPPKKSGPKPPKSKKDLEKKPCSGKECVDEAEMEATGDKLKVKIADAIKRVLYLPEEEEVELVDLEGYAEGQDTFFAKLSFKD